MRTFNGMGVLLGILFVGGRLLRADELPSPVVIGSYHGPTGNTYRQNADSPKDKLGEMTGTIKVIDQISGKMRVQDAKGTLVEFSVEENSRIEDHHLQINLVDLRIGDRVNVGYNVEPRVVNRIDRL